MPPRKPREETEDEALERLAKEDARDEAKLTKGLGRYGLGKNATILEINTFDEIDAVTASLLILCDDDKEQDVLLKHLMSPTPKSPYETTATSSITEEENSRISSAQKLRTRLSNLPSTTGISGARCKYDLINIILAQIIERHADPEALLKTLESAYKIGSRKGTVSHIGFLLRGVAHRGSLEQLEKALECVKKWKETRLYPDLFSLEEAETILTQKRVERDIKAVLSKPRTPSSIND